MSLAALRRFANDARLADPGAARRRIQVVDGVGTLGAVAAPAPLSLVPIRDDPHRVRLMATMPMHLTRAPIGGSQTDFVDVGSAVATWEADVVLAARPDRGGWRIEASAVDGVAPDVRLSALPAALDPALADGARSLLTGLATAEAAGATRGLLLARVAGWPEVEGPARLGAVDAAMDGALLRVALTPAGNLGPGLTLGDRALDPGAGNDATVALSPAWLSALGDAAPRGRALRDGEVDYRVHATLEGEPPTASARARRAEGCGWIDVRQPLKVGRSGSRWGIAPRGEAAVSARGGADRGGADEIGRAIGEAAARLLDAPLQHPLLTAPDGRRLQPALVRYERGAVLFDGVMERAPTGLRLPPGR